MEIKNPNPLNIVVISISITVSLLLRQCVLILSPVLVQPERPNTTTILLHAMFSILSPVHSHRPPLGSARNSGLLHGLIVPSLVAKRCPFIRPSVGDVLLVLASECHRF